MTREEASRLNITDSLQIRPNNDFGGMLAVMHNLHCLVRLCLPSCFEFVPYSFLFSCFYSTFSYNPYINTLQRRVRQMMYTNYYYPDATEERLNNDRRHTRE
jgi:hypothetical protein